MRKARKLSRRMMLRGIAGAGAVTIGLPLLDAMVNERGILHGTAQAATDPKRFFLFHYGYGVRRDGYTPTRAGTDWAFTMPLEPLRAHREHINVITGLTHHHIDQPSGLDGPHAHYTTAFTGVAAIPGPGGKAGGISIDQALAAGLEQRAITRGELVPKLGTLNACTFEDARISWTGRESPFPAELNPRAVFNRMFMDGSIDPDEAALVAARKQSMLDVVQEDIVELQGTLGSEDKARLDEHLTTVRALERAVSALPSPVTCSQPPQPADRSWDRISRAGWDEYIGLQADLLVLALRCDITRVCVLSLGSLQDDDTRLYGIWPDVDRSVGRHGITHPQAGNGGDVWTQGLSQSERDALRNQYYDRLVNFEMSMFASVLDRLAAEDGAGVSLLDSTMAVALSEFGDVHDPNQLPVIVAGHVDGLVGGRHLVYPCDAPLTSTGEWPSWTLHDVCEERGASPMSISRLWLTALQALEAHDENGDIVSRFGDATQTLPGLFT